MDRNRGELMIECPVAYHQSIIKSFKNDEIIQETAQTIQNRVSKLYNNYSHISHLQQFTTNNGKRNKTELSGNGYVMRKQKDTNRQYC